MRELAGLALRIGDCGAAALAALRSSPPAELLGDRVLLIATEGPTDPDAYAAALAR